MTNRRFVYGSLAPGKRNGHVLGNVPGRWEPATVTGALRQEGWGAAMGYPGIVLDPAGAAVEGFVFSSGHLFAHWARLDAFEGEGYHRVLAPVQLGNGTTVDACIYALPGDDRRSVRQAPADDPSVHPPCPRPPVQALRRSPRP